MSTCAVCHYRLVDRIGESGWCRRCHKRRWAAGHEPAPAERKQTAGNRADPDSHDAAQGEREAWAERCYAQDFTTVTGGGRTQGACVPLW